MDISGRKIVEKLDSLLTELHLDRITLAEHVGITPGSISHWKQRNSFPTADVLYRISKFLNVPMEYIISDDDTYKDIYTTISKYQKLSPEDKKTVDILIDGLFNKTK